MKITSEDLAKLLGIKIGDKIINSKGEVADVIEGYILDFHPWRIGLYIIIDEEFEIVRPKKKLGEKLCEEIGCDECPLLRLNCPMQVVESSLYEILKDWYEINKDKEIYNILKARLDKEVEEWHKKCGNIYKKKE